MYKVIKMFIDKESAKKYEVNSNYTPSSQERAKELVDKGFIEEVKAKRKPNKRAVDES